MSNLDIVVVFVAVILLVLVLFGGRYLYKRSVLLRNRLQMGQVFTNISHELLTPLTVLSASIEQMRQQEPAFEKDYALMELNIERMVHLLQEILETSKSLAGELKLSVAQGDVMQYINQTALCLEPLMVKKHIDFSVTCTPKSMMGWIDTDKLDKIIYNLVSNAAKYTEAGGKVTVTVNTSKRFDHVIIEVRDTGIGIPKDKMKNLFHRFNDGDYRKMQTIGTGLGLALVKDLVYLHEGTITFTSEEGKGTVFVVSLPINKEAFNPSQISEDYQFDLSQSHRQILDFDVLLHAEPTAAPVQPEHVDEDVYRILLVEDNIELLMLMQTLLGRNYYVCTAHNGREALEVVEKEELDLIISDVMMPEIDGNELTRILKSNPNTSHLPIILLTAKLQEEDRQESMLIGADDYITKPFKLSDLTLRITNLVENRKRIMKEFKSRSMEESRQGMSPDDLFVKRAIDCVYAHLDDADFDRDSFASEMGASGSTLYNKLRAITGLNVTSFIRDIRMKEAKRKVLAQPDIRVSDLAYQVGFRDPKYFSTCFKKEFGMQPSEYIDQVARGEG